MKTIKTFADDENHQGLALRRTEAVKRRTEAVKRRTEAVKRRTEAVKRRTEVVKRSVGDWNSVSL